MSTQLKQMSFQSSVRFDAKRIGAAAVYCSDGRFGDQFDDLLHNGLQLPRYDRLALPGGAACLASHFAAYQEEEAAIKQLRFLIEVHRLERVVLIAHQDCAFYTHHLQISPLQLETQQREDMQKAAGRVRSLFDRLVVEAYFARRLRDGTVQFERVQ